VAWFGRSFNSSACPEFDALNCISGPIRLCLPLKIGHGAECSQDPNPFIVWAVRYVSLSTIQPGSFQPTYSALMDKDFETFYKKKWDETNERMYKVRHEPPLAVWPVFYSMASTPVGT
jgi:hypothetical protein